MTDAERMAAAREFFWRMAERNDAIVTPQQADRLIRQLAEAIPPFTRVPRDAQP